MIRTSMATAAGILLFAGLAQAQDAVTCKGVITSKQGQGLVVKTFRFEVGEVTGSDVQDVLEKCKKIALQRQNKAARPNPGIAFGNVSDVDLTCTKAKERFTVQRSLQTR